MVIEKCKRKASLLTAALGVHCTRNVNAKCNDFEIESHSPFIHILLLLDIASVLIRVIQGRNPVS